MPAERASIGGVILEILSKEDKGRFNQPRGVFIYNGQQYEIPLRYIYYRGQIFDFGSGIEATIRITPMITQAQGGVQMEEFGSAIYLSPKTMDSLFAQLYLMNDAFERYETVKLAHSESDPVIASLRAQGVDVEDIAYFQGFRGPIKIWEVDYPSNIIAREEFIRASGDYAEFDGLEFTR